MKQKQKGKSKMKALKVFFGVMIGAVALVLAASPAAAQAAPVPTPQPGQSDFLQLNSSTGAQLGFVSAQEGLESNTALFQFDHQLSNPGAMGHYIEIMDPVTGLVSDVVGVASGDGTGAAGTNVFGFMSATDGTGLSAANIAAFFKTLGGGMGVLDETLVESATSGIFIDSSTDVFLASYINSTNASGGRAFFFSDGEPDGGSALALLGMALTGIEFVRRKFRKA
jgi:hypothetical protein